MTEARLAGAFAEARVGPLMTGIAFGAGTGMGPAVGGILIPIRRALPSSASLADFSIIAFCLSSSLAKMGTRSAGMGLLSLNVLPKLTRSANRLSLSIRDMAFFFCVMRCLSLLTKLLKLTTAGSSAWTGEREISIRNDISRDGLGPTFCSPSPFTLATPLTCSPFTAPSGPLTESFGTDGGGEDIIGVAGFDVSAFGVVAIVPSARRAPGGT